MKTQPAASAQWSILPALLMMALLLQETPNKKQESCWDTAKTQVEMNECAVQEYRAADAEMHRSYEALLGKHREDTAVVDKLKAAQGAWLAYRDAHLEANYPEIQGRSYGSLLPMCQQLVMARLTEERARILKEMLSSKEGDTCAYDPPEAK